MSARLLGAAFAADMGTHVRKLVLLKMVDEARDDGTCIYPSIERIASAAQSSVRHVRREIRKMEAAGLARCVANETGGRGRAREYELDLAVLEEIGRVGFNAVLSASGPDAPDNDEESSTEKADTTSAFNNDEKADNSSAERRTSETQKADSWSPPTPYRPLNPPVEREARAGEAEAKPENDAGFQKLIKRYPGVHSPGLAFPAWRRLDDEGRRRALARLDAYLAERRKLKNDTVFALQNYLRERIFDQVDEPADGRAPPTLVKPRTDEWWALFWRRRRAGERVVVMLDQAKGDGSWGCDIQALPDQAEIDALAEIETGSEQFRAWAAQLASEGLRLGGQACGRFVRVPSEWPQEDVKTARAG